ncbi:MAG: aldo/keto reductase [Hymenobacteraceae bacterium]|nr:aldo/keto reductase [Hymenobacteraceae bacterium]
MKYKLLGRTGLRVSELCLGTNTFGTEWGIGTDKEGARKIFDTFTEAGGNFFDTANNYNHGTSEKFLGEFVGHERDQYVIATKFSMQVGKHMNAGGNGRKHMRKAVEDSLRRLNTDYIDLLYLHAWDGVTPAEEVVRSFDDLVREGKVNYIGLSDTPAWVIGRMDLMAELRGWSRVAAMQLEYSLVERSPERELIPLAKELEMAIVAWHALGAGVLTGKYNKAGGKGRLKENSKYRTEKNLQVAEEVLKIAEESGKSPAQVAINWVRQQHPLIIPLIGSSKAEQTKDNIGCLDFELEQEQLTRLHELSKIAMGFPQEFLHKEGMEETLKNDVPRYR